MPRLSPRRAALLAAVVAVACRSTAPSSRPATPPVEIPVRYEEGRWYAAPVTTQGETLLFYTDSGGGANMFLAPVVDRLKLPRETVEVEGRKAEVVALPAFQPGASIPPPAPGSPMGGKLLVVPYEGEALQMFPPDPAGQPRAAGFLGQGWLAGRVWTFDYPAHRLFLRASGDLPAVAPGHRVALGFQTGPDGRRTTQFARLPAEVAGETLDFLFDTGATTFLTDAALQVLHDGRPSERAASFVTASSFARWHRQHPEWRVIENAEKGSNEAMIEAPAVTVGGVTVGPVWFTRRPDKNFHVYMFQWMDKPVEGALGGSAFQSLRVTVDYPNAVAVFEKP